MDDKSEKVHNETPNPAHPNVKTEDTEVSYTTDAVFGESSEEGPNYRNVGWKGTVALMMKVQVGLGVLSIPSVFDTLGMVPGVICLIVIGCVTTWANYEVGRFKIRHPEVYGIDDAGGKMFGRVGRELFGLGLMLYWICVAGSGMLSLSIGFNALTTHGTCTAVFLAVAALLGFGFGSIQTLGRITWLAWVGLAGIFSSILVLTVAVGVQDRPIEAPQDGPWQSDFRIVGSPSFAKAAAGLSAIVFAYAGTPGFFAIVSEMRELRYYTRALVICQSLVTAIYISIGCVVYYFCGSYVASPALGSAGVLLKQVCYGLAFPGLIVTTALVIHFTAKLIFVRTLRGSRHLSQNTLVHWIAWLGCTFGLTVIAYIIASAIPIFGDLVSLVGAVFGTLMSFQPTGCMWLYDHWTEGKASKKPGWIFMVCWCAFVIISGTFLMIAGTYGSIVAIAESYKAEGRSAAWSCADNSVSG